MDRSCGPGGLGPLTCTLSQLRDVTQLAVFELITGTRNKTDHTYASVLSASHVSSFFTQTRRTRTTPGNSWFEINSFRSPYSEIPCHQVMQRPRFVDGGDGLQVRRANRNVKGAAEKRSIIKTTIINSDIVFR